MAKNYRFGFKRLDVYQEAVAHFDWTCEVVQRMPKGPWRMVNQAVSASLSIMGNIGEANGRDKKHGEVEQHYRYSQGSTFESATHLDAFASLNVITDDEYNAAEQRLARIAAMLTRLMQRQRRKARGERQNKPVAAAQPRHTPPANPGKANVARPASSGKPGTPRGRGTPNPRASGVPAGAKRPAGIEPSRSEVPARPQGASGIESRSAGPQGSEATEGDRTPTISTRLK